MIAAWSSSTSRIRKAVARWCSPMRRTLRVAAAPFPSRSCSATWSTSATRPHCAALVCSPSWTLGRPRSSSIEQPHGAGERWARKGAASWALPCLCMEFSCAVRLCAALGPLCPLPALSPTPHPPCVSGVRCFDCTTNQSRSTRQGQQEMTDERGAQASTPFVSSVGSSPPSSAAAAACSSCSIACCRASSLRCARSRARCKRRSRSSSTWSIAHW
mmetsp:Transcript_1907/g.5705  ORF Transcript_1907/g.5705 Transcript_1907/m.5705 type:complete len:216 (+) Transcript_1907:1328-1975(+)